ncbi:response regulator [Dyadobacter psychrotolerans]|uniref:Response regulator n=2 Tax=Dyadobacter psychrotolerans TaxID=2541721 RepID=A0A4R5DA59_9BACT|nr:response regulator [Dyadobacter psychrotolerans]
MWCNFPLVMRDSFKLLVIDDDQDDHEIFRGALDIAFPKAFCEFALDRADAIKTLSNNKNVAPDYIFMDWNMPKMDAEEFMRQLRLLPDMQGVGVFVLSGSAPYVELEHLHALGVKKVLMKQASIALLSHELINAIGSGAN